MGSHHIIAIHGDLCMANALIKPPRNTLDCEQSNVYSSHVVFSAISQDLPFGSFSLYHRSAVG